MDTVGQPSVTCIIKLGGAALTIKDTFETLNSAILEVAAAQIEQLLASNQTIIIVHGAGSFGHFQAAQAGLAQGGGTPLDFSETRLSVTKLNHLVVTALTKRGIPAVGVSPVGAWRCRNRAVVADGCSHVAALLSQGFVPVLHGDAVFDESLKYTILGGDPIMARLCQIFRPHRAVFMTNVEGVFDRPPNIEGARRLRAVLVDRNSLDVWEGVTVDGEKVREIETSELAHDTTGGVKAKVAEAAGVVAAGTPVRVVQAGTPAALQACELQELPEDWIGTEIITTV